ncbi:MAG TPA: hypothetical protein VE673_05055 [Pseudonocardiaceae bacterium]|nr:hypothetical protein [Pseudonocardiaceae bacterium]
MTARNRARAPSEVRTDDDFPAAVSETLSGAAIRLSGQVPGTPTTAT